MYCKNRQTILRVPLLLALLAVPSRACFGVNILHEVTAEQAEELGLEVRSYSASPGIVGVVLEFKTEGALRDYQRVDLAVQSDGAWIMSTALREEESKEGNVKVGFHAARGSLDGMSLVVETGDPPLTPFGNRVAYQLQIRDFIALDELPVLDSGFSVEAPLSRDAEPVRVQVSPEESLGNFHYSVRITVSERVDQTLEVRNGVAVTPADVRLVDVNADGFLDLTIVGGEDHRGEEWLKTWLFDPEANEYRWIND